MVLHGTRAEWTYYSGSFKRAHEFEYSMVFGAALWTLTPGGGQNHVGKLGCGGDLGDPSTVTLKGTPYCHLLGHFGAGNNHLLRWMELDFVGGPNPPYLSHCGERKRKLHTGSKTLEAEPTSSACVLVCED